MGTALDSPIWRPPGACQSKTAGTAGPRDAAATARQCLEQAAGQKSQRRHEMTTSIARKALLGTAISAAMGIGYAIGAQPHMSETITMLQSARSELAAATPNKGGHRERALGLIDQAISEVRAGMAFAGG